MKTKAKNINREALLALHIQGASYAEMERQLGGVTRQRMYQILNPPLAIREYVWQRTGQRCQGCGVPLGTTGHYHQPEGDAVCAQGTKRLETVEYLCRSCHYQAHEQLVRDYLNIP